jgi:HK97 family phage major capsid protein
MSLKDLQDKQAQIVSEARERLDQINAATDEGRAKELEIQHDTAMAEYDRLSARIEREQKQAQMEQRAESLRAAQRPLVAGGEAAAQDAGSAPTYRAAFYEMLRHGGQVGDMSPEMRQALRTGIVSEEIRAQTAGTTTAGGFTVPVELAAIMTKSMAAWGPMYDENICTALLTASGNQINLPTVDDTSVVVVKHTEGSALTDDGGSDVTFAQKRLDAYVFDTEFIKFSMELAQDSIFNIEQLLGELLGERLGRRANTELTTGDGSGDPNGIVTASSLGKTAAATGAITVDELIDLQHSVDPAYRMSPKARFMFNDSTLAAVRKLKGGDGQYIWQMGDIRTSVPGTLLGSPYSVNQAMASLATGNKTVVYGDFAKYFVRKVGSPMIGVMRERFWPDLGIAGLIRLDGELADTAAVKHLIMA